MGRPKRRFLSLSASVLPTTLALMVAHGENGADAGLRDLRGYVLGASRCLRAPARLREALPFPVYIVSSGNLRDDAIAGGSMCARRIASVPWFITIADGSHGMGRRQCTAHYKLEPIRRQVVEMLDGKRPRGGTEMWVGISTDEAFRVKPSRVQYIVNRWPLIERRMNRSDCHAKLASYGWSAPKSSCIGCPFHSDSQWQALEPDEMADAIVVDRAIRRQGGMKGDQFMHRSRRPLDEVDLRSSAERGQPDLFLNECEGMCGV